MNKMIIDVNNKIKKNEPNIKCLTHNYCDEFYSKINI